MADYAISNVPRRVVYAASGTGPYAFTFEILDETDIAVYKASTLLTLTTDYTVTINANGTGSVTLVATAGTSNITIVGAKNIQRTSDFTTGGDLFANTLNDELDNQTIYIQQVAETAERGLKAPVTDPTDIAMTLPAKDGRKGKVLAFDSTTGNPVAGPALDSVVTVIEQSANINTVADNIADVIIVADDIADVNTVAGVAGNVTTVAGSISNVNAVGADLLEPTSEINTVATDIANINTVGANIASVNAVAVIDADVSTVATNQASVNTVATNIANVNATAANITNVNAVGADLLEPTSEINTVATDITNVNTVGANIASVNTVAGISSNISTVAGISANVTTVAGISANVTTVAGISGNVTTVAGISSNVTSVANNESNINQVAADTVVINSASANATAAAASALSASGSATSASASAAAASAVALGNEPVRHSVRPSLLLDFTNTKTLDPRITFTRGSTATYFDNKGVMQSAASGVSRFDHNPSTGESLGLLIEEQRTNLLTYSEQFDNAAWASKLNTTVSANAIIAPDGTLTGDKLVANSGSSTKYIDRTVTVAASTTHAFSVYMKAGEYTTATIYAIAPSAPFENFSADVNSGSLITDCIISSTLSIDVVLSLYQSDISLRYSNTLL